MTQNNNSLIQLYMWNNVLLAIIKFSGRSANLIRETWSLSGHDLMCRRVWHEGITLLVHRHKGIKSIARISRTGRVFLVQKSTARSARHTIRPPDKTQVSLIRFMDGQHDPRIRSYETTKSAIASQAMESL